MGNHDDECYCYTYPQLLVGKKAPDFGCKAYHKGKFKDINLSDYRGKWLILFFYPADFTFVCPTELTTLAGKYDELRKMGVEVFGISMDTEYTHMAWNVHELSKMTPGGVPYPMLADNAGSIGRAYGVFDEESELDIRGTFFIDPDGVVQAYEVNTPPLGRSTDELMRKISGLIYIREHEVEALPCNWEPNKKTLKPGEDLVGKVGDAWNPEKDG